jgi:hypothetical protein
MTVISYPIPPYSNVPIHAEYYNPNRFVISAVTLGLTTIITTTENMNFVIGQQIRLLIPPSYGCYQLNETLGYVLSIPQANQVEVSIDSSRNVDAYIASSDPTCVAQILPIGDINMGKINATGRRNTGTFIPGSFINVS